MADNPFPPGAAVACYLRDSGGDEQDLSVEQQQAEISTWCQARGLRLTNIFPDKARPGSTTVGREQFHQMLEHFRNGAQEAGLVIWRSNRFGRNVNDSQFHKADLRRRGYIVHSIMDDIPDGPAGQLVEFVLDWKDQIFLDQLSEDVKRGLRQNLLTHGVIPNPPPRGFRRELVEIGQRRDGTTRIGHRWVIDEEVAPLALKAFEMRAQGISLKKIQAAVPLYKTISCWCTFFDNEIYLGILHFGDMTIPDYCPAIVPLEIFQAVQARKQIKTRHPRREGGGILLSGLVECQICGHSLNWHTISGNHYYICSYRKRSGQCDARHIPGLALNAEILRLLREHILNVDNAKAIQARMLDQTPQRLDTDKQALHNAEKEHAKTLKEISNVMEAIRSYGHSPALFADLKRLEEVEPGQRETIKEMREKLQPVHQVSSSELNTFIEQQRAALEKPETARDAVRQMIQLIRVQRTDTQIIIQLDYIPPHLAAVRSTGSGRKGEQSINLISIMEIKESKRHCR
jgi:site-specific DNA recombinase